MREPISRAAAFSPRIRSCSDGSGDGQGKTSSSWISPMKSDFANDEAERSGFSSSLRLGRGLHGRSVPQRRCLNPGGDAPSAPGPRPDGPPPRSTGAGVLGRIVALGVGLVLFVLLVGKITDAGKPPEPPLTPAQLRANELNENPVELTLSFSGDLLIHTALFTQAQALAGGSGYDFAPMLAELKPYVEDADLAFCHVEVPMTPDPPASYPIFNTPPELAEGIAETGWDACDTASNHTLDQSEEGVGETIKALEDAGVKTTGSATNQKERDRPLIMEADGIKVGYVACTTDTNGIPVPKPYIVNICDKDQILDDAKRAKQAGADAVIVQMHWASELVPGVRERARRRARRRSRRSSRSRPTSLRSSARARTSSSRS